MQGTIAPTDFDWHSFLQTQNPGEVNFWTPSTTYPFRAERFSPFLFKLKAPYNAICGFGYFAQYSPLPDWLAWEVFGTMNGCRSLEAMRERIGRIRGRMRYRGTGPQNEIGCILIVEPSFFERDEWIPQPTDWPIRSLRATRYNLASSEGQRVWNACLDRAATKRGTAAADLPSRPADEESRHGRPLMVRPRLGQGTFRIAVLDAYSRSCAITGEHSLPALEASHIRPFEKEGPHEIGNGLLLRADLHRLFDKGYLTVTTDCRLEVSPRLRLDYHNGRSYYPLQGSRLLVPASPDLQPAAEYLRWHNDNIFRAA